MDWPQDYAGVEGQLLRVDATLAGFTLGSTAYPAAYSPLTVVGGGIGVTNSLNSIGCVYADLGTTDVEIGFLHDPQWQENGSHLEASPLLGVVPGDSGFAFGFWPSGGDHHIAIDAILPAKLGNPPSNFEIVGSAMAYARPAGTAWLVVRKIGNQGYVWYNGVYEGVRTVPEPYASSTLHGLTVDAHLLPALGASTPTILPTVWVRLL